MRKSPDECCRACAARGEPFDIQDEIRDKIARFGWTAVSVAPENPYAIGFSYTIGLEALGRPELITFSLDAAGRSNVLDATARKLSRRTRWDQRFMTYLEPGKQVQLLPVSEQWRDVYTPLASGYWSGKAFRLWQVRLPGAGGRFSREGVCCMPPCQPLLDRADPWPPLEHNLSPLTTDVLWHRVVDTTGVWEGRWEQLSALRLDTDHFVVCNVPFLADDVCLSDVVRAAAEPSGRRVIHSVVQESGYVTTRIECEAADEGGRARVDAVLAEVAEDDNVAWECSHWHRRHWTIAVPRPRVGWVEDLLRPLLRDGLAGYEVVVRPSG